MTTALNEAPATASDRTGPSPYKLSRMIIDGASIIGVLGLNGFAVREFGWREGLRPRWIWNVPRRQQKYAYWGLILQLAVGQLKLALDEHELNKDSA